MDARALKRGKNFNKQKKISTFKKNMIVEKKVFQFNTLDPALKQLGTSEILVREDRPTFKHISREWMIMSQENVIERFTNRVKNNMAFSYHEVIPMRMCNFFIDFDKVLDNGESPDKYYSAIREFKKYLSNLIPIRNWVEEDSSKQTKVSRHLKTQDICFKNPVCLGEFLSNCIYELNKTRKEFAVVLYSIIDWSLYQTNHSLRMYYTSKAEDRDRKLYQCDNDNVINKTFSCDFLLRTIISLCRPQAVLVNVKTAANSFSESEYRMKNLATFEKKLNSMPVFLNDGMQSMKVKRSTIGNDLSLEIENAIKDHMHSLYKFSDDIVFYNVWYLYSGDKHIEFIKFCYGSRFCPILTRVSKNPDKRHDNVCIRSLDYNLKTIKIGCSHSNQCTKAIVANCRLSTSDSSGVFRALTNKLEKI